MSNEENNKKTIDNLKNQEIDGENTKGGTSINQGPMGYGNQFSPYVNPVSGANDPGIVSETSNISGTFDNTANADVMPLNDNGSDKINPGDFSNTNS